MKPNFLQQNLQKIETLYPESWVITLVTQNFDLENLANCGKILTSTFGKSKIIAQNTLVSALDWQNNTDLPQHSQTSPATTLQWVIVPTEKWAQNDVVKKIHGLLEKQNLTLDIHVMPIGTACRPHKLALFDMDSTLIEQEVIVELAKKAGIGEQVNAITESAMRGEIDFSESFTRRVGLLKGLSKDVLDEIIRDNISFSLGAKRLISALKNNGYHVVLVSGGFTYFAEFVQKKLGIDEIYANDLDIVDGKLTGEITSPIVDGKRKAEILQEVAKRLNIDLSETVAVGDGANDLPMLGLADIGIAYRAKPIVQAQANYTVNVAGLDGVMAILGIE